jgi:hypothetical protein
MIQGVTLGTIKKRWQIIKDKLGIGGKPRSFKEMLSEWYETLNMHILQYIRETIGLQVGLPSEFIDGCRQLQNTVDQQIRWLSGEQPDTPKRKLIRKSQPTASKPVQQRQIFSAVEIAKAVAQAIVNMELRPLFDTLVAALDIDDPEQRDSLWSSFQRSIIFSLLQSIRPHLSIDITSLTNLLNEELSYLNRPSEDPQLLGSATYIGS